MSGVDPDGGDLQGAPKVYYPYGDAASTPAYEHFRDPAAAHGWQNAYDDTVQLDEIPGGGLDRAGKGGASYTSVSSDRGAEGGPDAVGRRARPAGGRRATLGRRRARRRRVLVAGGVGAALLVGVAVAGLAGLGSSEDQVDPSAPTPRNSATAGDRSGASDAASPSGTSDVTPPTASSGAPSEGSTASAAAPNPSGPTSRASTEAPSATPSPSPSSTAATGPTRGNSGGNQGQGQGATKAPN